MKYKASAVTSRNNRISLPGLLAALSLTPFVFFGQQQQQPTYPRNKDNVFFGKTAKPSDTSRTIRGQILDESGSSLSGVVIKLKNNASGKMQNAVTSGNGKFEFRELNANEDYEVTISHRGSNDIVRKVSRFDSRKLIELNLRLEKKEAAESKP